MNNDVEIKELNIQPQAGVIGVFSRLNYKPWYAIAEFVDNSTQSFYSHQKELKENGITDVIITINYDSDNDILSITDSAYGMEFDDFARAVKIDSPPENKNGRNEFGMGLKTAASWFGNVWSVKSTAFGSKNQYYTEINIPHMRKHNVNFVEIHKTTVDSQMHGTTIVIREVTKKIGSARTKNKITELLKSMYRRDLNNGLVQIIYDGEPLYFDEYSCLTFRDKEWRKNVDFSFEFDGIKHNVVGFVGILANGGFGRAGFALFRRGRVVVGGEEYNYKPQEIFQQSQSTISHKLFGELDLDDFPINQAKDGFVWDDGLEEEFIYHLKSHIQEYIDIAKLTNKQREEEENLSKTVSDTVQDQIQKSINKSSPTHKIEVNTNNTQVELFKEYQSEQNNQPEKVNENVRLYNIPLDSITNYQIAVQWVQANNQSWISVEPSTEENIAYVRLNINHPFFKPFSSDQSFKVVLEKFAIAFVLAEHRAKLNANSDGLIAPNAFRSHINKYLKDLSQDE